MTIIASVSWIRGTIWWKSWENLTPIDIVKFTTAYGMRLKQTYVSNISVIVWKDARLSWHIVENIVISTLSSLWINVINIGLSSTPTVEIAVTNENAQWGIVITASHNPRQRNALKLLNSDGEFLNAEEWNKILSIANSEAFEYIDIDNLGKIEERTDYDDIHIQKILDLKLVDQNLIKSANFTIAIDGVNSVWWVVVPKLLKTLWVQNIIELYCEPTGEFPHNPEPIPQNLTDISNLIKQTNKINLGIVVDPDVDRLAFITEDGSMFGEEYTLVAVADYILQNQVWNTVSNYLSSRALRDVTHKHWWAHRQSSVGEVNVVQKMKQINAVIWWEWNGGIIYPSLHYGRDALVGIALFLTYLATTQKTPSEILNLYPHYEITKLKIKLNPNENPDIILNNLQNKYKSESIDFTTTDGIRIEFSDSRVHVRKSNTEPILRVYAEATTKQKSNKLAQKVQKDITQLSP